jgi:hypothetical protein
VVVAATVLNRFKHRRDFGFRGLTNYSGDAAHQKVSGLKSQVSVFTAKTRKNTKVAKKDLAVKNHSVPYESGFYGQAAKSLKRKGRLGLVIAHLVYAFLICITESLSARSSC